MPLTPKQIDKAMQAATLAMLSIDPASDPNAYAEVRTSWPTTGQPGWKIDDDVCFLRCVEEDDEYNRIRDSELSSNDDTSVTETTTYTRVWRVFWVLYGKHSFDRARMIRSALQGQAIHDLLASSNLYFVPNPSAPQRVPELFGGQWWERTDFSARFNELVTETETIPTVASVEVIVNDASGVIADITTTKE